MGSGGQTKSQKLTSDTFTCHILHFGLKGHQSRVMGNSPLVRPDQAQEAGMVGGDWWAVRTPHGSAGGRCRRLCSLPLSDRTVEGGGSTTFCNCLYPLKLTVIGLNSPSFQIGYTIPHCHPLAYAIIYLCHTSPHLHLLSLYLCYVTVGMFTRRELSQLWSTLLEWSCVLS